jgi:hypothetical protein
MANTFELIASSTVGAGGAATIDFTSIVSTFTDLCLKVSLRGAGTSGNQEYLLLRFNNDSGSNYTSRGLAGGGGAIGSGTRSAQTELWCSTSSYGANNANDTANTFSSGELYIPNYLGSTQKSVSVDTVVEQNSTSLGSLGITAGIWTGTSAINRITIFALSGNWAQYTTAYLYGVKNA